MSPAQLWLSGASPPPCLPRLRVERKLLIDLSRVNNTVIMAATALAALSPLVAGLPVQHVSGRWALGAFAAAIGVAAVMCIGLPWLRDAESAAADDLSLANSEPAASE